MDGITGLVVSSDSSHAVTFAYDNTARLWDLDGGICLGVMHHNQAVTKAIFSADNRLLLTASADNIAYVWSCDGRQPMLRHVFKVSPSFSISTLAESLSFKYHQWGVGGVP